ncbi:MAG: hypothetical protein IKN80_06135 [Clostridiales bacterium]|nr:hypothetical protein [Clostridiales bacterium]
MMERGQKIRKYCIYAAYLLLFTTIQVTFPGLFTFYGIRPDLMFVMVVLCAYMFGFYDGMIFGALTGIIRDYLSAPAITVSEGNVQPAIGLGLLLMVCAAAFGSAFFTVRVKRNFLIAVLSVIAATVLYKACGHLIIYISTNIINGTAYNVGIKGIFLRSVLPQTLLNLAAAVPFYALLKFAGPYSKGINPYLKDERKGGSDLWLTM